MEAAPPERPDDPTAFTRVIEVEDYAGEDKQLEDLLESTPGVFVRRFGGPGEPSEVSIRGSSGSQVVVLLDGVRLNSAQSGTVDLSTIPLDLIERIEVTRGGGAVESGQRRHRRRREPGDEAREHASRRRASRDRSGPSRPGRAA